MTIDQVDVDASKTRAQSADTHTEREVWVAPSLATVRSDEPWQESLATGTVVRRQFVFVPSPDPWDNVNHAREAMDGGAPRVLRLRPGSLGHRFPLADWILEPLPAVCEREGYALALDYGPSGAVPLAELASFGGSTPEVPLLVMGGKLCEYPAIWRLLDRCPNVLLQITSRARAADVATGVSTFGHHRFVFGSRGFGNADEAVFELLDEDERHAVLSDNAHQLDALRWRELWL